MTGVIHYRGGYKYQLTRTYRIHLPELRGVNFVGPLFDLSPTGYLTVMVGYAWDGATAYPDRKTILRGSLVHDVLYQAMRLELLDRAHRREADKILRRICREDGMIWLEAQVVYGAVRAFAGPAAHPDHRRIEMVAP